MSPRITAVVCAGWAERAGNVQRIVDDLLGGTVIPDRIFVLDNTEIEPGLFNGMRTDRVRVLQGHNTECHGKFVAALYEPAHYYLMADDDTSVGPRTLECLLRHAGPGFVTGYWGVHLNGDSFMGGCIVQPCYVEQVQPVDAFHGRVMFMAHDALARMLAVEGDLRAGGDLTGDDILAGLANPGSVIVPMRGEECFVDLGEYGIAMQHRAGYFEDRDEFTRRALAVVHGS